MSVTRVTSGALASQGIYCLGEDLHRRVVTDLEKKLMRPKLNTIELHERILAEQRH